MTTQASETPSRERTLSEPTLSELASPPRLREGATRAGALLREATLASRTGSHRAFSDLLKARRRRQGRQVLALAALVCGGLFLLPLWPAPSTRIEAEPLSARKDAQKDLLIRKNAVRPTQETAQHTLEPPDPSGVDEVAANELDTADRPAQRDERRARLIRPPVSTSASAPSPGPREPTATLPAHASGANQTESERPLGKAGQADADSTPPSERSAPPATACARLARDGDIAQATACYRGASESTGAGAELALIEHARLELLVKGDKEQALQLLDSYFTRFPKGALRPEAKLMQLDLLASRGQHQRLVIELQATLAGNLLPERRTDLLGLQAETLAKLDRCNEALGIVAQAKGEGTDTGQNPRMTRAQARCTALAAAGSQDREPK